MPTGTAAVGDTGVVDGRYVSCLWAPHFDTSLVFPQIQKHVFFFLTEHVAWFTSCGSNWHWLRHFDWFRTRLFFSLQRQSFSTAEIIVDFIETIFKNWFLEKIVLASRSVLFLYNRWCSTDSGFEKPSMQIDFDLSWKFVYVAVTVPSLMEGRRRAQCNLARLAFSTTAAIMYVDLKQWGVVLSQM
jgi:hypothetical protein